MKIITQGETITGATPEEIIRKLQQGGLEGITSTQEYMQEVRKRVAIYLGPETHLNDHNPREFLEGLHQAGLITIIERGNVK